MGSSVYRRMTERRLLVTVRLNFPGAGVRVFPQALWSEVFPSSDLSITSTTSRRCWRFRGELCGLVRGEERKFIEDFRGLGVEARAMVVRLENRSGSVFRVSALKYKELPDAEGGAGGVAGGGVCEGAGAGG